MEGLFGPIIKKLTDLGNLFSNWVNDLLTKLGNKLLSWVTVFLGNLLGGIAQGRQLLRESPRRRRRGWRRSARRSRRWSRSWSCGWWSWRDARSGLAGASPTAIGGGAAAVERLERAGAFQLCRSVPDEPITIAVAAAAAAGFGIYKARPSDPGAGLVRGGVRGGRARLLGQHKPKGIRALFDALGVSEPRLGTSKGSVGVSVA